MFVLIERYVNDLFGPTKYFIMAFLRDYVVCRGYIILNQGFKPTKHFNFEFNNKEIFKLL